MTHAVGSPRAGDGKTLTAERRAFEAWAGDYPALEDDHGYVNLRYLGLHKQYVDFDVQRAWTAWQARAALAAAPAVSAPAEWRKAVQEAYGWLWHINNEPLSPAPLLSEGKAAYQARKALRELLTSAERGEAINAVTATIDNIKAAAAIQAPGAAQETQP
jgi:hypothetical protein